MASVNFLKCKAGAAAAVMLHCGKEERLQHDHQNPDIDLSRTGDNSQSCAAKESIALLRKRLNELDNSTNTNHRKDRVECLALETAAPIGMDVNEFRVLLLQHVQELYGEKNVISWYQHVDEIHEYWDHGELKISRPHYHVFVVPEHEGKLAGKWATSKSNMIQLNKKIDAACKQRGFIYMTGEAVRHQTVEQLKAASVAEARDLNARLAAQKASLASEIQKAEEILAEKEKSLKSASTRFNELDQRWAAAEDRSRSALQRSRPFHKDEVILPKSDAEALLMKAAFNESALDVLENAQQQADQLVSAAQQQADQLLRSAAAEVNRRKTELAELEARAESVREKLAQAQLAEIQHDHPEMFSFGKYVSRKQLERRQEKKLRQDRDSR